MNADVRSRPCLYGDPCQKYCTCANPMMSHGCKRCCTYGSLEQREAMAKYLVAALKLVESCGPAFEGYAAAKNEALEASENK